MFSLSLAAWMLPAVRSVNGTRVETHRLESSFLGRRDTAACFVSSENVVFLTAEPQFVRFVPFHSISQSNSWLLCSILLLSVSLPLRSALFRYKWWSFERRVVSVYNVCLHISCIIEPGKGMRFATSVETPAQHASFCAVSTDPNTNNQCLGWTIDGRSKKGRLLYTPYFCTLHAYLRSAYACAWIILSNIQRWTRLWSRAVLHRWSTMDGARRQYDGTLQMVPPLHSMGCPYTNFKMGHVERPLNWNIWKFSLSSDFFEI